MGTMFQFLLYNQLYIQQNFTISGSASNADHWYGALETLCLSPLLAANILLARLMNFTARNTIYMPPFLYI